MVPNQLPQIRKRRHANTLVPISVISDDVLSYTFCLLLPSARRDSFRVARKSIRLIAQVCHRWRTVAIGTPSLWNKIELLAHGGKLRWIEEMWRRSSNSLVELWYFSDEKYPLRSEYVPHLRALHMSITPSTLENWNVLTDKPKIISTQLEVLEISVFGNRRDRAHECVSTTHTLSLPAMESDLYQPRLKHLTLRGCLMDFNSPVLSNLSVLAVRGLGDSGSALTIREWLFALRNLFWLTELTFCDAIAPGLDGASLNVDLPHLRYLSLDDDVSVASALLGHLNVPLSCILHLSFQCCRTVLDLDAISTIFASHLEYNQTVRNIRSLKILASASQLFIVHGEELESRNNCISLGLSDLASNGIGWMSLVIRIFFSLTKACTMTTSLTLEFAQVVPELLSIFHKFNSVTTLSLLDVQTLGSLIPYLRIPLFHNSDVHVMFPSLEVLTLNPIAPFSTHFNDVFSFVYTRLACNRPLKQLRLERVWNNDAVVTQDQIDILKTLGVRVDLFQSIRGISYLRRLGRGILEPISVEFP